MTSARHLIRSSLLGLCGGLVGLAAADDWTIDPANSSVRFHGSSTLHNFDGTAKLISGALHLDGVHSTGAVIADAVSMDTADASRDKDMHTDTMLVATWPIIRFDLTTFVPAADGNGGTGSGTWTMHGVAKAIDIPVTFAATAPAAAAPGSTGTGRHLRAHFVMDIRTWNIKPPRTMLVITVDPNVTIDLDLVLIPGAAHSATTSATASAPGSATAATTMPPASSAAKAP